MSSLTQTELFMPGVIPQNIRNTQMIMNSIYKKYLGGLFYAAILDNQIELYINRQL